MKLPSADDLLHATLLAKSQRLRGEFQRSGNLDHVSESEDCLAKAAALASAPKYLALKKDAGSPEPPKPVTYHVRARLGAANAQVAYFVHADTGEAALSTEFPSFEAAQEAIAGLLAPKKDAANVSERYLYLRKFSTIEKRAMPDAKGEARFNVVISDGNEDRDGDTVLPSAWKLDEYRKNPVVLLHHDRTRPVGRIDPASLKVDGNKLVGVLVLPPVGTTKDADEARGLIGADILRTLSAGFRVITFEPAKTGRGFIITGAELREVSVVAIPAVSGATIGSPAAAA